MADAQTTDTPMTVAEFLAWDPPEDGEKYELVDGVVTAMGRERVSHVRAKLKAVNTLNAAIGSADLDCEALLDGVAVSHAERFVRIPDVVVHCGAIDGDATLSDNPVILVEVISPSSAERDEHIKLEEYFAMPSVAHYLVVHVEQRTLVHHARTGDGAVATRLLKDGPLALDPPGLSLDVKAFFA